jgi:bifunctional DNase/RNase
MNRRTLLVGAAALTVAGKALAQTTVDAPLQTDEPKVNVVEATVEAVYSLLEPELSNNLVVVLKARTQEKYLPIWIGMSEGLSIQAHLQKEKTFRPLSHDFMAELIKGIGGDVESISITLRENVYYAVATVIGNGRTTKVDGRPSDAIALAVRFDAPIFVDSDLFKLNSWKK